MEPEYLDKVHGIMQGVYGDKFTLDVDTFKDKMINETQYRDKIYGIMQGVYGDKFTLDPKTFYNKVLESSKKKSQSEIGSQATQPGDGSENAQYAFEPGFQGEKPFFQTLRPEDQQIEEEQIVQPNKRVIYRGEGTREALETQFAPEVKKEVRKATIVEATKPIAKEMGEVIKPASKIQKLADLNYMNQNPDDFNATYYDVFKNEAEKSGDPEKYSKDLKDKYANDFIDEEFKEEFNIANELRYIEDKMKKEISSLQSNPNAKTPQGQEYIKNKINEYSQLIQSKTAKLDEVRKANNQKYQQRIDEIDNLFKTGESVMREDALNAEKNELMRKMKLIKLAENPEGLKQEVGEQEYNKIPGSTADEKLNNYLNTRLTIYDQFKEDALNAAFDRNRFYGEKKDRADQVYNSYMNLKGELKDLYYLSALKRYANPEDRSNFLQSAGEGFLGKFAEGAFNFDDVGKKHSENLQKIAQEAGIQYSDEDKSFIEYTSAPAAPWSNEWWGDMTGTSSAFMAELALTRKPTGAILKAAGSVIKAAPQMSKIAQGALSRYDKLGKTGQKFVNTIFNAAEEGAYFEGANQMLHDGESSELTFLTGFTGALLAAPVNALLKKAGGIAFDSFKKGATQEITKDAVTVERAAVLESLGAQKDEVKTLLSEFVKPTAGKDAVYMISGTFGKESPKVIDLLEKVGAYFIARPTGEVVQEFGEELASIYQSTDNFNQFKKEFSARFPDADATTQFVVASYMMGVGFGGGNFIGDVFMKKSKQGYDALTPEQKKVADKAIAEADAEIKNKEAEVLNEQEMNTPAKEKSKEETDWDNTRVGIEDKISQSGNQISALENQKQKIYDKYGITDPKTQDISGLSNDDAIKIETINSEIQREKKAKSKEEINLSIHEDNKPVIEEAEESPMAVHADELINKNKENALQEPISESLLSREQGETTETGGQPQGMGQGVQGQEVAQQGETEAQRQERIAEEASAGAAEVVTGLNIPNALAASVFPVVGEVESQIEKGKFVNDEKSTEAQDKLYELLTDIDSREDLTPEQKQQMSAVIENRIQKIQDYDYRTRTETRTTTQTVATGVSPKTQKQNERAAIPVRTVAQEGVDVTYDGRRGKVELRNGEYVFIPAKTGAVQGKPVVIGEAAQVNANSRFAGVENPTKGPNAVVANITLPNGSTMSVLNDDLSVDIGLEIAKQEVGAAPQALFDTVFEEVVTENKVEVPYLRETKPAQEQAVTTEQVTEQPAPQVTPQVTPQVQSNEFTGTSKRDLELKRKYAKDAQKRRVLEQATRVASVLKGKVKIILHENSNDYKNARTNLTGTAPLDSEAGSFNYSEDGEIQEIHIDLSQATDSTIFHEATHAVLFNAFGENKELFQKFKDKLKPLLANSTVEQLEQFANNPNYVAQGVTAEEFLAEFSGLMASQGKSLPKSILQKIAQLINDFVSTITGGKLKPFQNTADTAKVIDFFNSMTDAFAKGNIIDINTNAEKTLENNSISAKSQSVTIAKGNETAKKLGLSEKYNNVRQIAEALELRQRKKYGKINKNDFSSEALSKISKWMTDEVEFFVNLMGDKSGKGWYGELFQKGIDNMSQIFPELATDQNARDLFTMLVAITSDGEKVKSNFRLASIAYDYYRKNNELPTNLKASRPGSINGNMKKLNDLLPKFKNASDLKNNLLTVKSISELNKERKLEGLSPLTTAWPVTFKSPFSASVFGPKLGMFYANLSGQEKYPTLDRWWSRTFNRYRGTLIPEVNRGFDTKNNPIGIDKFKLIAGDPNMTDDQAIILINENRNNYKNRGYKNGTDLEKSANTLFKQINENINDAPFNKSDREFMYDSFVKAQKSLNKKGYDLSIADIQAILWYYEKFLYKTLGAKGKVDGVAYGDVANFIVEKYKENNNSFNYDINPNEDVSNIEEAEESEMDDSNIQDEELSLKAKSQVTQKEAEDYIAGVEQAKKQDPEDYFSVSVPPIEDVKEGTIIKVDGGEAIVDKNGEIRGLYKYVGTKEMNVGDKLVQKAIKSGGIKLDNFALDRLMKIYQRNGFKVVSRLPFNEEYAPEGWNKAKHGTPDVVAMIYDPENKMGIEEKQFEDYYEAMAYRDSFVDAQRAAYPEGGVKSKSQEIPSSKAEQKEVISEMETAMNKTGLAKENAIKRFIEKYGEKGVVAKQINDNFDKIQEQLGITKICNI